MGRIFFLKKKEVLMNVSNWIYGVALIIGLYFCYFFRTSGTNKSIILIIFGIVLILGSIFGFYLSWEEKHTKRS